MKKAADITAKADFLEQPERWSGDGVARGRTITAGTRRPWNMELWHWNFPRVSLGWSVKQWIHMLVVWNGVDGFCLIALTTWRNLYSVCVCARCASCHSGGHEGWAHRQEEPTSAGQASASTGEDLGSNRASGRDIRRFDLEHEPWQSWHACLSWQNWSPFTVYLSNVVSFLACGSGGLRI